MDMATNPPPFTYNNMEGDREKARRENDGTEEVWNWIQISRRSG
jgi:hypothetical protein